MLENKKVLIVEDDRDIGELLRLHLIDLHAQTHLVTDGSDAMRSIGGQDWDVIILDIRLPGIDGLEICRRVRAEGNPVPILMLTAKTTELDRVLGLEVGADDYVLKPFSVLEVMARVRALLRRVSLERTREGSQTVFHCGALRIDEPRRLVSIDQVTLELTPREFDLLVFFARAPGKVFRRAQLLDQVWGFGHDGYEHTVNSHINRLRTKLAAVDALTDYIITVWGVGYKLSEDLECVNVA
ncbi:MAG: response regulator [Pseudomonadales bacterium]|nr:response regulator [Pseudomonadales bacterium]